MSGYLHRMDLPFLDPNDPVQEKMQKLVEDNNCIKLLQNSTEQDVEKLKSVSWFIDCGDDDFTFPPEHGICCCYERKTNSISATSP